jgi:hypothetical protein
MTGASKFDAMMRPDAKPKGTKAQRWASLAMSQVMACSTPERGVLQRSYVRQRPLSTRAVRRMSVHAVLERSRRSTVSSRRDWLQFGYIGRPLGR